MTGVDCHISPAGWDGYLHPPCGVNTGKLIRENDWIVKMGDCRFVNLSAVWIVSYRSPPWTLSRLLSVFGNRTWGPLDDASALG